MQERECVIACVTENKISVMAWLNVPVSGVCGQKKDQNSQWTSKRDKENLAVWHYSKEPDQNDPAVQKHQVVNGCFQWNGEAFL